MTLGGLETLMSTQTHDRLDIISVASLTLCLWKMTQDPKKFLKDSSVNRKGFVRGKRAMGHCPLLPPDVSLR